MKRAICLAAAAILATGCGGKSGGDDAGTDTTSDSPDVETDVATDPGLDTAGDTGTDGPGDPDPEADVPSDPTGDDGETPDETCTGEWGTTWYVRPGGGDDVQCTGLADADYPGSGSGQACAFSHPFFVLPPSGTPRLAGGDRLVIASGDYRMGLGADGDVGCASDYPYDCTMAAVPSGLSADEPTCIVGAGWNEGCPSPPELWGAERASPVLDLTGADHVRVECLEITDHEGCVEFHSGDVECDRMGYPFGDWAGVGIAATDSSDVVLVNLDIHGMANRGILAGRLTDWTLEGVDIVGNGWAGFDGDVDGDDSNGGTIAFRDVTIAWNGCGETWPGREPVGCWGQSAGGYGDGLGTGSTGGDWVFEGCDISHNTSDGLDLLYHDGSGVITIDATLAEGNAGNQIKTRGETHITNTVMVGNCGFFSGQPFTHDVDDCRALGNTLSVDFHDADTVTLTNCTLYGEGDCLVVVGSGCPASPTFVSRNNVFLGDDEFLAPGDTACFWYSECADLVFDQDRGVVWGTKHDGDCPWGADDICEDPDLAGPLTGDAWGMQPTAGSPAVDSGLGVGEMGLVPDHDILGVARPQGGGVDRGAFEITD